jgi:hypothetical protein
VAAACAHAPGDEAGVWHGRAARGNGTGNVESSIEGSANPADFSEWTPAKRNEWFAEEAKRYRYFKKLDKVFADAEREQHRGKPPLREQETVPVKILTYDEMLALPEACFAVAMRGAVSHGRSIPLSVQYLAALW